MALDDVEGLVLVAMDVRRGTTAGRDERLHGEVRVAGLRTGDEEPVPVPGAPEHVAGEQRLHTIALDPAIEREIAETLTQTPDVEFSPWSPHGHARWSKRSRRRPSMPLPGVDDLC